MGSQKPLSYNTPNSRRNARNISEADNLRKLGYSVFSSKDHPNGAYYALEKGSEHHPHEIDTVKILAENGISTVMNKEGVIKVGGNQLPSFDGKGHGMTFEIRQTREDVSKNLSSKVADAIQHSKKSSKVTDYVIQADVAVSYTKNKRVSERHVKEGIESSRKRKNAATPKYLLQVDGINRKVYFYKINGG